MDLNHLPETANYKLAYCSLKRKVNEWWVKLSDLLLICIVTRGADLNRLRCVSSVSRFRVVSCCAYYCSVMVWSLLIYLHEASDISLNRLWLHHIRIVSSKCSEVSFFPLGCPYSITNSHLSQSNKSSEDKPSLPCPSYIKHVCRRCGQDWGKKGRLNVICSVREAIVLEQASSPVDRSLSQNYFVFIFSSFLPLICFSCRLHLFLFSSFYVPRFFYLSCSVWMHETSPMKTFIHRPSLLSFIFLPLFCSFVC